MRDYLRWLWPHRYAVAWLFALGLVTAGLQLIEPLFMRFIIDRVLLNDGSTSEPASRLCTSRARQSSRSSRFRAASASSETIASAS